MDELYHDPGLVSVYDALNSTREDFDFYLAQLPPLPATVADVGCGTGTFAVELSHRGYAVTGIEPAGMMLAQARAKDGGKDVRWIEGTMADVPSGARFDAIVMTGHAFQCILHDEDVIALFGDVERRLAANGAFLFETRNPAARAWEQWTPEHAGDPVPLAGGGAVRVVHRVEKVDGERITFSETYELTGSSDAPRSSSSTLRFMSADRIVELARRAGLSAERIWGTWTGDEFDTARSPEIIFRMQRSSAISGV
ncbi:class I SAM-dependent methyltransferase [Boseongicola sp. H5]|uniref:class I SAM-dependent methyltransferase n=1 Tax=Boseongicola sp. H5 TaxID=2763261 RepID=UPI001D0A7E50|nr:class I SAM-dependent methyltransferase [Boseongicola sp. H5]